MNKNNITIVLAILFTGTLNGCTALIPDSMLTSAHQEMDLNHDGYIDYNEYLKSSSNEDFVENAKEKGMTVEEYQKWEFERADTNSDGKVTTQEFIDLFRREFPASF